jgi:hypothetical protein
LQVYGTHGLLLKITYKFRLGGIQRGGEELKTEDAEPYKFY